MKKFLSMLLVAVMASSMFAVTAFAAGNVSAVYSATEVKVGEEFTITINSAEKTVYMDDTKLRFGDGNVNFKDKFEIVSIADCDGFTEDQYYYLTYNNGRKDVEAEMSFSDQADNFTWSYMGASAVTYYETEIATVTLKALEAGEYTFQIEEYSDNTQKTDDVSGYNGVVATQKVVVKGNEPETDETITGADATPAEDETAGTRTWTVTAGKDLFGQKLKATLTNSAKNETQEVELSFGGDINGEASIIFDVIVKFTDYVNNAPYTTLKIEKAN